MTPAILIVRITQVNSKQTYSSKHDFNTKHRKHNKKNRELASIHMGNEKEAKVVNVLEKM